MAFSLCSWIGCSPSRLIKNVPTDFCRCFTIFRSCLLGSFAVSQLWEDVSSVPITCNVIGICAFTSKFILSSSVSLYVLSFWEDAEIVIYPFAEHFPQVPFNFSDLLIIIVYNPWLVMGIGFAHLTGSLGFLSFIKLFFFSFLLSSQILFHLTTV